MTPGSSTRYSQMDFVGQQIGQIIERKRAVVGNHSVGAGAQPRNKKVFVRRGRETFQTIDAWAEAFEQLSLIHI